MPFVWDFVVVREDGVEMLLHPNYSNTKMEVRVGSLRLITRYQRPEWVALAEGGPLGNSLPNTFTKYCDLMLRRVKDFRCSRGSPLETQRV